MKRSSIALALILGSLVVLAGCESGDGDDIQPIDAPLGIDGPAACVLPSTVVNCTVGDNTPCTALCAQAYCHLYNQVGQVCTSSCEIGGSGAECPTGWTCNTMGRCRPPG